MRIDDDTRTSMLKVLVLDIGSNNSEPQRVIVFQDDNDNTIVELPYSTLENSSYNDVASYTFLAANGYSRLRVKVGTSITVPTEVTKFYIQGLTSTINGSVSPVGKKGDLEFNRTEWVSGDIITVSQLSLVFPQGK